MVANVSNFMTGYVNPQFHVVFDKLFQIVFSSSEDDMMVKVIHNVLFESIWDLYAEDDFNAEEELI